MSRRCDRMPDPLPCTDSSQFIRLVTKGISHKQIMLQNWILARMRSALSPRRFSLSQTSESLSLTVSRYFHLDFIYIIVLECYFKSGDGEYLAACLFNCPNLTALSLEGSNDSYYYNPSSLFNSFKATRSLTRICRSSSEVSIIRESKASI